MVAVPKPNQWQGKAGKHSLFETVHSRLAKIENYRFQYLILIVGVLKASLFTLEITSINKGKRLAAFFFASKVGKVCIRVPWVPEGFFVLICGDSERTKQNKNKKTLWHPG